MDDTLSCISTKGKLLWKQKMPAGILTIQPLDIASRGGQFIAVSLSNRKVLLFEDKHVVDWVRNNLKNALSFLAYYYLIVAFLQKNIN